MKKIIITPLRTAIFIALVIVIVVFVAKANNKEENYDKFAQCLTDNGAVMYGTYWCKYCNSQKADFGDSFQYIDYVECTEEADKCTEKEIQGFPSWIINEQLYTGKQPFERLSALTGCELPEVE